MRSTKSLILFQTAEVFQSPDPRAVVSLASSSNRPAIDNVVWLDDNDTILFLGERPGESTDSTREAGTLC